MELEFVTLKHDGEPLSRFYLRSEARRILELSNGDPLTAFRVRCRLGDLASAAPEFGYSEPAPTAIGDVILCRGIDAPHDRRHSHAVFVVQGPAGDRLFFSHASVRQYARMLEIVGEQPEVYTARFALSGLDALAVVARGGAISVDSCGIGSASIAVEHHGGASHHAIPSSALRTYVGRPSRVA